TAPSSPNVNTVTNDRGFMPLIYALRYGIYIVPHSKPAPSAAATPVADAFIASCVCQDVAYDNMHAPMTMAEAPPRTFSQCPAPASRNSPKRSQPHTRPTMLLVFHRGKAIDSPIRRIAKTVSVLATAHKTPARIAQTIR